MSKKIINIIAITFFIFLFFSCGKREETKSDKNKDVKYIAYYFHPTARCESCINLENYIKELIELKYSDKGFSFKEVNIEQKENEHYRKDYELQFSSVIIENLENKKWKNLDSIWSFTNDKDKFIKYSESEINQFMNIK
jgi:hypothetical protein